MVSYLPIISRFLNMFSTSVTSSCAQHLYALKLLWAHGMCEEALQQVFRAVIISKIFHDSSAWWGFTSATDRQHLKAFHRRSVRTAQPSVSSITTWSDWTCRSSRRPCLILKDNHILSRLAFYCRNLTVVTTCSRNIITENYYKKHSLVRLQFYYSFTV